MEGKPTWESVSLSNALEGCSNVSAYNSSSLSNSALTIVYKRRKFQKEPYTCFLSCCAANKSEDNSLVYQRRKPDQCMKPGNHVSIFPIRFFEDSTQNVKQDDTACATLMNMRNLLDNEKHADHEALNESEMARSSVSVVICSDEPVLTHLRIIDGCSADVDVADVKDKEDKLVELHSVDDSCSSSMVNINAERGSLKTDLDEHGECSSSGAFIEDVTGQCRSEKNFCISMLRSQGLLSCIKPDGSFDSGENAASCSGVSPSLLCNICGFHGSAEKMLICDHCEEAFHVSCCSSTMRKFDADEWFCLPCFKKKLKKMKEATQRRSKIIWSDSSLKNAADEGRSPLITLMLQDREPYVTGVRIGKAFQAVVPDWSGPITKNISIIDEPQELMSCHENCLHEVRWKNLTRPSSICNWLQCRDIIVGGKNDGAMCGKWRRAPLFQVQTDNWDCFSSVLWDPAHADCAVPQELETEEVLRQLKYIEMLRPRLMSKRKSSTDAAAAVQASKRPLAVKKQKQNSSDAAPAAAEIEDSKRTMEGVSNYTLCGAKLTRMINA